MDSFSNWWYTINGFTLPKITAAGKNFASFDLPFILKTPKSNLIEIRHRSIDPGTLWMKPTDEKVPNTKECMCRAGIDGEVAHTAVEDAIVVIKLIRKKYGLLD